MPGTDEILDLKLDNVDLKAGFILLAGFKGNLNKTDPYGVERRLKHHILGDAHISEDVLGYVKEIALSVLK